MRVYFGVVSEVDNFNGCKEVNESYGFYVEDEFVEVEVSCGVYYNVGWVIDECCGFVDV